MAVFSSIIEAFDALRTGHMVIVVDDATRENEGDIIMAAEHITEEKMAFVIRHTGGVVCVALSGEIVDHLKLSPMVEKNTSNLHTPFTISIEAAKNVTTGISAHDRAVTVRTAVSPIAKPEDLVHPGHIFPLRAKDGGVLRRAGHTEASVDLCRLAGVRPCAVLSELMHDDGTMMRKDDLHAFAKKHSIPIISIADLIAYRRRNETLVRKEANTKLETDFGTWDMAVYKDVFENMEHIALVKGEIDPMKPILVRVHSECFTGDVLQSLHCDCGDQLRNALRMIDKEGSGVLIYMKQEGRGIGLINKVRAYELQQREGLDTVEANEALGFPMDLREYGIGAQILKDIGVGNMRLITNNPKKIIGLEGYGLHIQEQVSLECSAVSEKQKKYLRTKKIKMGHTLRDV
jgi:3,4-dihydroxy 2-butanone 4-phosphate synthase / GTP cyclohydrolase II